MTAYAFALIVLVVVALVAIIVMLARALEHAREQARAFSEKLLNALLANEAESPAQAFGALEEIREPGIPAVPANVTEDFLTRERLSRAKDTRDGTALENIGPRPIGMGG